MVRETWELRQLKRAAPKQTNDADGYEFTSDDAEDFEHTSSDVEFDRSLKQVAETEGDAAARERADSEKIERLPVLECKSELEDLFLHHQITIVSGETGSGKTTQIPQFLQSLTTKQVVVTQPRRLAAMAVASRVAAEQRVKLGAQVGYTVRFDDRSSASTKIRFVTDGMLVSEFLRDPKISKVGCVVVDEAHERTLSTDIVLALLHGLIQIRPDLKVVVASATLSTKKFSDYFGGAPVYQVPGRRFPVDIWYAKHPEKNYLQASLETVLQIHMSQPLPGDILVFLPGQDEIEQLREILEDAAGGLGSEYAELIVLPLYSALPPSHQARIFDPAPQNARKCVLATNIAETSLTIDGIVFVVDPGLVKELLFDAKTGMDTLSTRECSQASAQQRAGRAGRTQPGQCYRLYSKRAFEHEHPPQSTPEVLRTNLASVALKLLSLGQNPITFSFMDRPPLEASVRALEQLYALQALNAEAKLTTVGRQMAELPVDPMSARALLAAAAWGVLDDVATLLALVGELGQLWFRPRHRRADADRIHREYVDPRGDHFSALKLWRQWTVAGQSQQWCRDHFVQYRSLRRAQDVRTQLLQLCRRLPRAANIPGDHAMEKALLAGFFANTARLARSGQNYVTLRTPQAVAIHPSSTLANMDPAPSLILYTELVLTSREFVRGCLVIEPSWLEEVSPHFYREKLASISAFKPNRAAKGC